MTTNGQMAEATGTATHAAATPARKVARIEYTVETRRGPVRRAREVSATSERMGEVVEREIDKLVDRGGFNFDVRYEA
jgi:hypothetical protein